MKHLSFVKLFFLALFSIILTGCGGTVVSQGNFAVEKYWGGAYNEEVHGMGYNYQFFDTLYEIYGKEHMLKIEDVRPKDKDSIMLKDLDLNISYKALKDGAVRFLLKTEDIVKNPELKVYILGSRVVQKDAQAVIGHTMRKFSSEELLDKPLDVENAYKQDLQKELDSLYGKNTFEIVEVKIANVQVAESVENKIQAIAAVKAETEKNAAIRKILETREDTLTKEARVISNAAAKGGITVDQLLSYETIKAMKEMDASNLRVNVDTKVKTK